MAGGTRTYVYAPEVAVFVKTWNGDEIDLSQDVVSGSVQRVVDSVSTASVTLDNRHRKYTKVLNRMDRIVISFRRDEQWIQCFSGYLTRVPELDLYPTTCTIQAECTLKSLLHTYWDPGLPYVNQMLRETLTNNRQTSDSGFGAMIAAILKEVAGWNPELIKIQDVPAPLKKLYTEGESPWDEWKGWEETLRLLGLQSFSSISSAVLGTGSVSAGTVLHSSGGSDKGFTLSQDQANVASAILNAAQKAGATRDEMIMCIMTAIVESHLTNPSSGDRDSVGAFQQRAGWGSVQQRMDLDYSTRAFLGIGNVGGLGYRKKPAAQKKATLGEKCQAVQVSAFPDKYGYWQAAATQIVDQAISSGSSSKKSDVETSGGSSSKKSDAGGSSSSSAAVHNGVEVMGYPFKGKYPVTSPFGTRIHPVTGAKSVHEGTDFGCPSGTTVLAALSGTVSKISDNSISGHHVIIDHGGGLSTWYLHLTPGADKVRVGDKVAKGQAIALSDNTGRSTGAHLHFGVYINGKPRDAMNYLGRQFNVNAPDVPASPGSADTSSGATTAGSTGLVDLNTVRGLIGTFTAAWAIFNPQNTWLSQALTGDRALMNDEPVMSMVQQYCKGSMRSFMSGPDGSFIAFYPDRFGLFGTQAKMTLEDIEMVDVKIESSDDDITTHVYTIADMDLNSTVDMNEWQYAGSEALLKDPFIHDQLLRLPKEGFWESSKFIERFGARPYVENLPYVHNRAVEKMYALFTFMEKWSGQYKTSVSFTFLPELFPGMRVTLASQGIQVYVESVSHNFSYSSGFTTSATISSPSRIGNTSVVGLPWGEL